VLLPALPVLPALPEELEELEEPVAVAAAVVAVAVVRVAKTVAQAATLDPQSSKRAQSAITTRTFGLVIDQPLGALLRTTL
jgi:hypothetical protein